MVLKSFFLGFLAISFGYFSTPALAAPRYSNSGPVRVTAMSVFDLGDLTDEGAGSDQIDLTRNICEDNDGNAETITYEDFTDTVVAFNVENETGLDVRFYRIWFLVPNVDGTRRRIRTKRFHPLRSGYAYAEKNTRLYGFFMYASQDAKTVESKTLAVTPTPGFRNVTAYLEGVTLSGKRYRVRATTVMSFNHFDRCQ